VSSFWDWLRGRKADWALLALLALLCIGAWRAQAQGGAPSVFVYAGDRLVGRWPLASPHPIEVRVTGPLGETLVEIGPLGVRIRSSPCPRKLCVHSGWHRRIGDAAICVPNRVVALIRGGEGLDAIVR